MYTKEKLKEQLRAMGIEKEDVVMVHTSLRSVGPITGDCSGAEIYIQALRECVKDGLLLIPAHTWANVRNDGDLCDLNTTPPCIGTVPTVAVQMAAGGEGIRSRHPTHSVVAFGAEAEGYIADDEHAVTPAPWNGSFGKLYAHGGKILLVGVDQGRNTFFHAVDEWLSIPDRLCEEPARLSLRDREGKVTPRPIYRHKRSMSDYYMNYEPYLEQIGAVRYGMLGNALTRVCDARACAEAVKRLWQNAEHDLCAGKEVLDLEKLLKF